MPKLSLKCSPNMHDIDSNQLKEHNWFNINLSDFLAYIKKVKNKKHPIRRFIMGILNVYYDYK